MLFYKKIFIEVKDFIIIKVSVLFVYFLNVFKFENIV